MNIFLIFVEVRDSSVTAYNSKDSLNWEEEREINRVKYYFNIFSYWKAIVIILKIQVQVKKSDWVHKLRRWMIIS